MRAAGTSRLPPAWTPTTPWSAAIWAKPTMKRNAPGLDEREYAVAKELDPKDPTPWFYDAIAKQTTNRPVEALHDLQQAIELNDNRAVYRSRLLLDADLAARSASLGRIYSDLGFQQLALVEGWKSVNTDPTNFSAHRFLADSYAVLPRHEIARVSELLQSQLLQPINITPIQPRLAESNLFLISAGGPGAALLQRVQSHFQPGPACPAGQAALPVKMTPGLEKVSSPASTRSFPSALGTPTLRRTGFASTVTRKMTSSTPLSSWNSTPNTSMQAEYRYRNTERGDLQLRFFPEDFFPGERNTEERHTIRLGARHAFSPGSILLGSFIYQDAELRLRDDQLPPPVYFLRRAKGLNSAFGAELQHLFRSRYFNLTSGAGYFDIDGRIDTTFGLDLPPS